MITLSTKNQMEGQIQWKKIHIYWWIQLYSCTYYFVELWLTPVLSITRTLEGKCLTTKHNSKVTYQSNFWAWASGLPTFMHSPGASRDIKSSHTASFPKHKHCKVDHRNLTNQSEGRRLSLNKRKPVRYKKIYITSVYRRPPRSNWKD
jgi:hypothetical protein